MVEAAGMVSYQQPLRQQHRMGPGTLPAQDLHSSRVALQQQQR